MIFDPELITIEYASDTNIEVINEIFGEVVVVYAMIARGIMQ